MRLLIIIIYFVFVDISIENNKFDTIQKLICYFFFNMLFNV